MNRSISVLLGCLVVQACSSSSSGSEECRRVATRLFESAAHGDSITTQSLSASSEVIESLRAIATNESPLLLAATALDYGKASRVGVDSTYVVYRFPYRDSTEAVAIGCVQEGTTMRVCYVGWPMRM